MSTMKGWVCKQVQASSSAMPCLRGKTSIEVPCLKRKNDCMPAFFSQVPFILLRMFTLAPPNAGASSLGCEQLAKLEAVCLGWALALKSFQIHHNIVPGWQRLWAQVLALVFSLHAFRCTLGVLRWIITEECLRCGIYIWIKYIQALSELCQRFMFEYIIFC